MRFYEIRNIVKDIKFLENWRIEVFYEADAPYLQVHFPDPVTWIYWSGRKWRLSYHMTKSEVVQTALAAVLAAVEHEAREHFLYQGRAIFGPHFNVDDLVELVDLETVDVRPHVET